MSLFRLFKKNKNRGAPAEWLVKSNAWITQRQHRLADALGRRTQYWSRGSWIVALALFIGLFGGCCLFLILHAFLKH